MEVNNNGNAKFNYTHAFLANKLNQTSRILKLSDLKELQDNLKRHVSFGPSNSKYKYKSDNSNFSIINMSLSDFEDKALGDSKILYDEQIEYGFNIDIQNNNSNTLNKIILGKYSPNIKQLCAFQRDVRLKGIIQNVKKIPSSSKIIVTEDVNVKLMFVSYKNHKNKKRVLFVRQEFNNSPGPAGPAGLDGATGPAGPAGLDGATGANGSNGSNGLDGATGAKGTDGTTGPGLQHNIIYVDNVTDLQDGINAAVSGNAVYMSPGSYGGPDVVISDKQNIAIVGVNRGQGTICELSNERGLTLSSSCNGSMTISNLQIEGLLTLAGKNNNYFTSVQCQGGITIIQTTLTDSSGNYFFSDCDISGVVTVPATFGGLITFSRCNMAGATFLLSNPSPLQVQFALCINLPASRPTNATYGSSNSDASLNITTDTTNLRINKSLGTSGQVLTSGGTGPAYWSSVVGVTGNAEVADNQVPSYTHTAIIKIGETSYKIYLTQLP